MVWETSFSSAWGSFSRPYSQAMPAPLPQPALTAPQ